MRKILFAFAVLVVLFGGYGLAATPPASEPTISPIQTLPPAGGAGGSQVQIPELDPGLQEMFEPIERELRKGTVSPGAPIVVQVFPPKPAEPVNPCTGAAPGGCVLTYRLSGRIDVKAANSFRDFMKAAYRARANIVFVEMTTDGGELPAGHEMTRDIENFPGTVVCVADHHVASMGMYLFQACDRRLMTKRASFLLHQVLTPVSSGHMNASELMARVRRANVYNRGYAEQVIAKTNVPLKEYLEKTRGREWLMNYEEALKRGWVDAVVAATPNRILMGLKHGERP